MHQLLRQHLISRRSSLHFLFCETSQTSSASRGAVFDASCSGQLLIARCVMMRFEVRMTAFGVLLQLQ